jgi:hypothetical protein
VAAGAVWEAASKAARKRVPIISKALYHAGLTPGYRGRGGKRGD